MNADLRTFLEDLLGLTIRSARQLTGGGAAATFRIDTTRGPFLVKHVADPESDVLNVEADGLSALAKGAETLVIPRVEALESGSLGHILVLEWLVSVSPGPLHHEALGRGMAQLHRTYGDAYGYHHDGWIGANRQYNRRDASWPAFYQQQRLEPQVDLARRNGLWESAWSPLLANVYKALPDLLPEKPPRSLLHGDCWNGNVLFLEDGRASLIDPAVYYGDRETDLAMTRLFGGFDGVFYAAYQEAWPLEPGYSTRKPLYDLYHMLNHLNLFGMSYGASVQRLLQTYG